MQRWMILGGCFLSLLISACGSKKGLSKVDAGVCADPSGICVGQNISPFDEPRVVILKPSPTPTPSPTPPVVIHIPMDPDSKLPPLDFGVYDPDSLPSKIPQPASLVDFGGMYGWYGDKESPNPITKSMSCPSGYTSHQVYGYDWGIRKDYPLYYCENHTQNVSQKLYFGGSFGVTYGSVDVPNPLTGAMNCPPYFTRHNVLGSYGSDYPFSYCYLDPTVPISFFLPSLGTGYGFIIPSSYSHLGFGGMFGYVKGSITGNQVNLVGADQNICPPKHSTQVALGTQDVDYLLAVCYQFPMSK